MDYILKGTKTTAIWQRQYIQSFLMFKSKCMVVFINSIILSY